MPLRNLGWLLSVVGVFALGFAVAYTAPSEEKSRDYTNMKLLVDVMEQVRKNYVTELTPDRERKLFEDMINGGLERLDPHSGYINPKEFKQFQGLSRGKFGGVDLLLGGCWTLDAGYGVPDCFRLAGHSGSSIWIG